MKRVANWVLVELVSFERRLAIWRQIRPNYPISGDGRGSRNHQSELEDRVFVAGGGIKGVGVQEENAFAWGVWLSGVSQFQECFLHGGVSVQIMSE